MIKFQFDYDDWYNFFTNDFYIKILQFEYCNDNYAFDIGLTIFNFYIGLHRNKGDK